MPTLRDLDWPDCVNVRDLGGLPVSGGGGTRFGVVVRSDHPSYLTPAGWDALWDYGIRTVISLETDTDSAETAEHVNMPLSIDGAMDGSMDGRRRRLTHLRLRIEDGNDEEFMATWAATGLWGTPLYFADALARWPRRCAALVHHIAASAPGGVLLHCGRGCDRTGLASYLLLTLAGVSSEDIAADYALSAERLATREPEYQQHLKDMLSDQCSTVEEVFTELATSVDLEQRLLGAGLAASDLATVRERMLAPM
jgi:protein-tyrosine phosphatase